MQLRAISIGSAVPPERFEARIHSLFRRACNLALSDDRLIVLLASALPDIPHGIRLDAPDFAFDASPLQINQTVTCRDGVIRFTGCDLSIDLRGAPIWRADLSDVRVDPARPEVLAAGQSAWDELRRSARCDGLGWLDGSISSYWPPPSTSQRAQSERSAAQSKNRPLLRSGRESTKAMKSIQVDGSAHPIIDVLLDATRRADAESACGAVAKLIGLGPGLTPSGDDFLVGYVSGLRCTPGGGPMASALSASLLQQAHRTTAVSRVFFHHAAQGQVSRALIDLARAIGQGDSIAARRAARAALQIGETSGADSLLGLLLGCGRAFQKSLDTL